MQGTQGLVLFFQRKTRRHLPWNNNSPEIYNFKFPSFQTQTLYTPLQVSNTSNTPTDFGLRLQTFTTPQPQLYGVLYLEALYICAASPLHWHQTVFCPCTSLRLLWSTDCTELPCSPMEYRGSSQLTSWKLLFLGRREAARGNGGSVHPTGKPEHTAVCFAVLQTKWRHEINAVIRTLKWMAKALVTLATLDQKKINAPQTKKRKQNHKTHKPN